MKNFLIVGLICLVGALSFGIEPVQRLINETLNRGTLRGVERCMGYATSEILSKDAIRSACTQAIQRRLYLPNLATGKAGPTNDQGLMGWAGKLENKTADHVTTWIRISVIIYDADGKELEFFGETPIWIEPMGNAEFKVELPDLKPGQVEAIQPCDFADQAPKACLSWGFVDVMGVEV